METFRWAIVNVDLGIESAEIFSDPDSARQALAGSLMAHKYRIVKVHIAVVREITDED